MVFEFGERVVVWLCRKSLKVEDRAEPGWKRENHWVGFSHHWQGWFLEEKLWGIEYKISVALCLHLLPFLSLHLPKHFLTKPIKSDSLPHTTTVFFKLLSIQTQIASGPPRNLPPWKKTSWLVLSIMLMTKKCSKIFLLCGGVGFQSSSRPKGRQFWPVVLLEILLSRCVGTELCPWWDPSPSRIQPWTLRLWKICSPAWTSTLRTVIGDYTKLITLSKKSL